MEKLLTRSTTDLELLSKHSDFLKEIESIVPESEMESILTSGAGLKRLAESFLFCKERIKEWKLFRGAEIESILLGCGVPRRFVNAKKFDIDKKIWDEVSKAEEGVFLTGPAGTGKTHLAVAMIADYLSECEPVIRYNGITFELKMPRKPRFISVPDLLLKIRNTFKEGSIEAEQEVIDEFTENRPTVFDDLGAEKSSEFSIQTLYTILNARYSNVLPTIITSNMTLAQVSERVGDRIASRIAGMCKIVTLKGADRRIKKS